MKWRRKILGVALIVVAGLLTGGWLLCRQFVTDQIMKGGIDMESENIREVSEMAGSCGQTGNTGRFCPECGKPFDEGDMQ